MTRARSASTSTTSSRVRPPLPPPLSLSLSLSLTLSPTPADARFFTREQVLAVINSTKPLQMTREQVSRLDGKEGEAGATKDGKAGQQGDFLMPPACVPLSLVPVPPSLAPSPLALPRQAADDQSSLTSRSTAIANTLVTAWANGTLFNQGPGSTGTQAPKM